MERAMQGSRHWRMCTQDISMNGQRQIQIKRERWQTTKTPWTLNQCKVIHCPLCHFRHYSNAYYPECICRFVDSFVLYLLYVLKCFSMVFFLRIVFQFSLMLCTRTHTRTYTKRLWTIPKFKLSQRATKNHFSFHVFLTLFQWVRVNTKYTHDVCIFAVRTLCIRFCVFTS